METQVKIHNDHCIRVNNCIFESITVEYNLKYLGIDIGGNMK